MTVPRPLPALTEDTRPFWTGGADGRLLIQQCSACDYYIHPPTGFCPQCEGRDTHYQRVSGKGFVETFSINHKQWMPGLPERYVLALVRIAEQADVRLVTNIIGCDPDDVTFDMPVTVQFEQAEDIWVPLFAPDTSAPTGGGEPHLDRNPPRNGEVPAGRRGRVGLGSILTGKTPASTAPSVSLRLPPPRSGEDFLS